MSARQHPPRLYLIPAFGSDARLYSELKSAGIEFEVLEWPRPEKGEKIQDYVKRVIEPIDTSRPFFLGGVSMGGMAVVEANKFISPQKNILISTTKTSKEFPWYFQLFRVMPFWWIFPAGLLKWGSKKAWWMIGQDMTAEDRKLHESMISDSDPYLIKWSLRRLVGWKNREIPEEYLHIHGNKDRLLPHRFVRGPIKEIPNGTHWMIQNKAEEIAGLIRKYLAK